MFRKIRQLRRLERSRLTDDEFYDEDENGRGIIDVGAENYDDIFSYYDLEGENVLDKEFDDFLDAKADAIPLKQELALHFHVAGATETKREEIERAIKNNYKRELRALNRKLHKNTMFTLYMLSMALLALAIYIPLEIFNIPFPIPYIFDIIAWVFVWEATDSYFLKRRNIQFKRLKKYRFVRADIRVYEYKPKKKTSKNFSKNVKTLNKMINKIADNNKNNTIKEVKDVKLGKNILNNLTEVNEVKNKTEKNK